MTRSTSEIALNHLLETIRFINEDHVRKAIALEGIVDIIDLFANSPHSYESYGYTIKDGTHQSIHKADKGKLVMFHLFYIYRQHKGEDVTEDFWMKMDVNTNMESEILVSCQQMQVVCQPVHLHPYYVFALWLIFERSCLGLHRCRPCNTALRAHQPVAR